MADFFTWRYILLVILFLLVINKLSTSIFEKIFLGYITGHFIYFAIYKENFWAIIFGRQNPSMIVSVYISYFMIMISFLISRLTDLKLFFKNIGMISFLFILISNIFYKNGGLLFNQNATSQLACLLIALTYSNKKLFYVSTFLLGLFFFLTNSMNGIFALLIGHSLMLLFNMNYKLLIKSLLISGGLFLVSFVLIKNMFNDNGRFQSWLLVIQQIKENHTEIFGHGFGTFKFFFPVYQQKMNMLIDGGYMSFAHNDWLQIFHEQGFIGLAIFFNLSIYLIYKSINTKLLLFFCTFFVSMFINFPMAMPTELLLFFFMIRFLSEENNKEFINGKSLSIFSISRKT